MVKHPNIRFAGFSDEWVQRKLGDYLTKSIEIKAENPSEIELLTVQLHHKGIIASGKMPKVTSKGRSYFVRHVGELIIGRQNFHNGGFGIAKSDVNGLIASSAIQSFDFKDNINPFFLISLMQRSDWLGRTEVFIGGTGQKEYSANVLLNLKIESTTLKEQQKIGSIFSTLDHKIGLEERQISLLKDLKKGYLQKMFPKNGAKVPELRFAGFVDDWEERKLGDEVRIVMGQSPNSENYTNNPNDYILVQGNADMKNGHVSPRVWTTQVTKQAEKDDLILSVRAPVGDIGKTAYDVVIGRGVAAIKGNEFIFQNLGKMKSDGYWTRYSTGSTFESINSTDIKEAIISVPAIDEQNKIGSFFKQLDNTIDLHQFKLDSLTDLKKGLLQQMFAK